MKLSLWIESLLLTVSFILLQTTKRTETNALFENYLDGTLYYYYTAFANLTLEERLLLATKHFTAGLNNAVGFFGSVTSLFKKIFVQNDVTSVYNLKILGDIYSHGVLTEEHLHEMFYCIVGHETDGDDDFD